MDVISLGIANKTIPLENTIRNTTLASGVQGPYKNTKERIDYLETAYGSITEKANKLIVKDTINLMKANARLNSIAKTVRYGMKNMFFDDLLDKSGIDLELSHTYVHDSFEGSISIGESTINQIVEGGRVTNIITINEVTSTVPTQAVLTIEEESLTVEDTTPAMISDTVPEPYRITVSSKYNNNYSGWRAFNKTATLDSLCWTTKSGQTTGSIQMSYGEKKKVNTYTIQQGIGTDHVSNTAMPRDWSLQGSNDGKVWDTLDFRMFEIDWQSGEERIFKLDKDANYSNYRLVVDANNGHDNILSIYEIKFFYIETVENSQRGTYSLSRDNGVTWEIIQPDTLFYFDEKVSPKDNNLRLKIELPYGVKLLNYGLTWA